MRVTVVGDVLLDVDINGTASRLSPDAPVPVVDVAEVRRRAGGAGLVATLLARDGHDVTLVTALSDDDGASYLDAALATVSVLAGAPLAATPTKTRVRIGTHQMVRFDEGCAPVPTPDCTRAMAAAIESAEVIVVADYGRGITSNADVRAALTAAASRVPVVWDPHPSGSTPVEGAAAVTPNLAEALAFAKPSGTHPLRKAAEEAGEVLLEQWNCGAVLVTIGEDGAVLVDGSSVEHVPAPPARVEDPCGAGDRLAGSLAVYLSLGLDLPRAAARAVADASEFLGNGGAASLQGIGGKPAADQPESRAGSSRGAENNAPRGNRHDGIQLARRVRAAGGTVVATGGCFDLLHAGHARTLAAARSMGDCLVVCLNSDDSVRRLKGDPRPIVSEGDRAELLLALHCVDAVVIFDEDTPEACIESIRPDLWVKGGDYQPGDLPEARLVESWGGSCVTVPFHPARSTSGLAEALAKVG
ncbi:MAG TPA: PfkB family carbohydrate kinase [Arthrobacter sp.]|nr:PfkB family carbohydrate kinase [Arthrobacter sp.]